MGKAIVFIIIFLILAGGLAFLYFRYEKPIQEKDVVQYTNLTIFAEDKQGELVKTGYLIFMNNSLFAGGETDKYGGVREVVTTNNEFVIKNVNLPEQNYYTQEIKFSSSVPNKNNRIDFKLEKLGKLDITQKGVFGNNDNIILKLSTNESFNNLMYCLKWSEFLIYVQSVNDGISDKTFDDNFKCYKTGAILNDRHNYTITINYNYFNTLRTEDYIRLSFYDNDMKLNNNYTKRQEYYIRQDINNI